MSLDDWLLALHVLSAFALVAGIVLFWVLIVAVRRTDTPEGTVRMAPMVQVGNVATGVGMGGTIVLGIWLAISLDEHRLWDLWVLGAIVLWVIAAALGQRTAAAYMRGMTKAEELRAAGKPEPSAELLALNRTSDGLLFHALATAVVLLIVFDMIWKPGA